MTCGQQPTRVAPDFVLGEHIRAFTTASNRVRHVTFLILIVSVLAFGGYRNSDHDSWTNRRVHLLRFALNHQLHDPVQVHAAIAGCDLFAKETSAHCRDLKASLRLLQLRNLREEEQIRERLKLLEEVQIRQVYNIQVPFFGVGFDVNDLGMLCGIALFLLTLTQALSVSREHENLHLCLFQVGELCRDWDAKDDRRSEANFLYHALAMAQLFTRPPTLARWRTKTTRALFKLILAIPFLVQLRLFTHDLGTIEFGVLFKPDGTLISLFVQALALLGIAVFVTASIIYSFAIDHQWSECFKFINPKWAARRQPPWIELIRKTPLPTDRRD